MSAQSIKTAMVEQWRMPISFNGDPMLLSTNLFFMTAFTYLGAMIAGAMISGIWRNRLWDKWNHPVTLHRTAWACAGIAVTMRCGAEAAYLWAWNPLAARASEADAALAAEMMTLKRYLDPVSLVFAFSWMVIIIISHDAMVQQLRKQPYPIQMWARLPHLIRPAMILVLAAIMAFGVLFLRG